MKFLFWNLFNKKNERFIIDLIEENNIDIAIFTEKDSTDFCHVVEELKSRYVRAYEERKNAKITLYHRTEYKVCVEDEQVNYSLYSIETGSNKLIVAGVHLPAEPWSDEGSREVVIRKAVAKIISVENELDHDNTLIIGDFNANPFDAELIQKDTFNAVLFKKLIEDQEYISFFDDEYKRFYNPMLHYISENKMSYGSYYYNNSGSKSLYWNCFDQIIVRKSLANKILKVEFCKSICNQSLMSTVMPNKNISDHLPLIVEIEGVN